jgi:uncharacterized membrane protein YeaQ/YmgE (transglycosylase-associated protein family)
MRFRSIRVQRLPLFAQVIAILKKELETIDVFRSFSPVSDVLERECDRRRIFSKAFRTQPRLIPIARVQRHQQRMNALAAANSPNSQPLRIPFSLEKSLVSRETPGHTRELLRANNGGKIMIHLIWYIVVGLIAGIIAKSVMHVHMTIFWTIVLGIIGSIIGGAVTHMFSHPTTGRFHPAGLIFSTLGAILLLYVCLKLNIRFPRVL